VTALEWYRENEALVWSVAAGVSIATFVGSLVAIPWLIARLPADHFVPVKRPRPAERRHPVLRIALLILKNLIGGLLVLAGVAMLVLPGQGLLAILMGLVLLDYPGKHRFERWLIRRRAIRRPVDWIRRRAGREPLRLPEGDGAE
jgi:hypothetical protein